MSVSMNFVPSLESEMSSSLLSESLQSDHVFKFPESRGLSLLKPDQLQSDLSGSKLSEVDSTTVISNNACTNPLVAQSATTLEHDLNIALGLGKCNILSKGIDLYGNSAATPKVQFKTLKGVGTLEYANGDVYKGTFVDNDFVGLGEMTYANGDHYVGEWKQSQMCGTGTYTFQAGDVYKGQFIQNKFNGHGELKTKGTRYVGEFRDDMAHGAGHLTFLQDNKVVDLKGHFYRGHYFGKYADAMLHARYEGLQQAGEVNMAVEECRESYAASPLPSRTDEPLKIHKVESPAVNWLR